MAESFEIIPKNHSEGVTPLRNDYLARGPCGFADFPWVFGLFGVNFMFFLHMTVPYYTVYSINWPVAHMAPRGSL